MRTAALGDATSTMVEKKELAEDREGAYVSHKLARQNAGLTQQAISKGAGGDELLQSVMSMLKELNMGMVDMKRQLVDVVVSHETSLQTLATGELDCPRLFVLLPVETSGGSLIGKLMKPKDFVKDKYRLVFLDPVTGNATKCGPGGHGYELAITKDWLLANHKYIADGMKVLKIVCATGRVCGLPLPSAEGLPTNIVSKAEVQAVQSASRARPPPPLNCARRADLSNPGGSHTPPQTSRRCSAARRTWARARPAR